jgi:hypothetical protein
MAENETKPEEKEEETATMLTLCITCSSKRVVLSFPAEKTTVAQLQQQARAALGMSAEGEEEREGDEQWHVNGVPRP